MKNGYEFKPSMHLKKLLEQSELNWKYAILTETEPNQPAFWKIALLGVLLWACIMALAFLPVIIEGIKELL